jgi:hypothetical protein
MRKFVMLSIIAVCIITLGFKIHSVFFTPHSSTSETAQKNILSEMPKLTTLRGVYSCLPNDEPNPLTVMCVSSLKLTDGSYAALNLGDHRADKLLKIETGNTVEIEGMFTPVGQNIPDQWKKYKVKGILKVTKITKS